MPSKNIKDYLINITGNLPQFQSFYKAQGINQNELNDNDNSLLGQLRKKFQYKLEEYAKYLVFYYEHNNKLFSDLNITSPNPLTYKIARIAVTKHAGYLMNKGFLVESDFYDIQNFLQNVWKNNFFGEKEYNTNGLNLALMGGITGDAYLYMYYDSETDDFKIDILESYNTFPFLEKNELKSVIYYKEHSVLGKQNSLYIPEEVLVKEGYYISKNKSALIKDDKIVNEVVYDIPLFTVYHIQNFPNISDFFGISDLASSIDLNLRIDRVLTNISDIIDYNSSPITIVRGAKPSDLVKGVNRVWFLPSTDSSVENLSLTGELTPAKEFLSDLINMLLNSLYLNKNVFGKEEGISNTPASGLALTLLPVYEYMEIKRLMYGKAILNINKDLIKLAILRNKLDINQIIKIRLLEYEKDFNVYSEELKNKFYPFRTKIKENIDYNSINAVRDNLIPKEIFETYLTWYPPFSRDEKISNDIALANVNSGLWSKRHARSYIGMTEKESILMDNEIKEEEVLYDKQLTMTNKEIKTGLEGLEDIKSNNSITQ